MNENIGGFTAHIKITSDTTGSKNAEKATENLKQTTTKLNNVIIKNGKVVQDNEKIVNTTTKTRQENGRTIKDITKQTILSNIENEKANKLQQKSNMSLMTANAILRSTVTYMSLMGAASIGAFYGANKFTIGVANWARDLEVLSRQTGISTKEFERWGRAGEIATKGRLKAQDVYIEMAKLQKQITDISLYGSDATAFIRLGIDPRNKDATSVMEELRIKIKQLKQEGKSNMQITSLIGGVIDPEMIPLLEQTRKGFDLIANHKMLSAQQRRDLDDYRKSWQQLGFEFKNLTNQTASRLAPVLERFNTRFINFLLQNGDKITTIIEKLTYHFLLFSDGVMDIVEMSGKFISNMSGMNEGLTGILLIFVGIATYLNPLARITAIGVALSTLLLDFAGFQSGKSSLFNWDWLAKFSSEALPGIKSLGIAVQSLTKDISQLFDGITMSKDFQILMQSIGELFGYIGKIMAATIYTGKGIFYDMMSGSSALFGNKEGFEYAREQSGKNYSNAINSIIKPDEVMNSYNQQNQNYNQQNQNINKQGFVPSNGITNSPQLQPQIFGGSIANYPSSSQQTVTNNNKYEININGNNLSAVDIASAVKQEIINMHQDAQEGLRTF